METDEFNPATEDITTIAGREELMGRLEGIALDIREVFAEDVESFASRAVRARFLEDESFNQGLTDAALTQLKARCDADGVAARVEVETQLRPMGPWLEGMGVKERAGLETVAGIWDVVTGVEARVEATLQAFGTSGPVPRYTAPSRFVSGRYLKTLVEHYWRTIQELETVESAVKAQERAWSRTELTKRWDAA